jgi:transcriptional regulator with XRE-family HTH domain
MRKDKIPKIHCLAFVESRQRLGLSIEALALDACLSKKQIQQIENGEQSAFYSAALKLRSAQKVATILGLDEADYLEAEIVAPPVLVNVSAPTPTPTPTPVAAALPTPASAPAAEKAHAPVLEIEKLPASSQKSKPVPTDLQIKDQQRKLFLYASVAAALVFAIINFGNDFSNLSMTASPNTTVNSTTVVAPPPPSAPLAAAPELAKQEVTPAASELSTVALNNQPNPKVSPAIASDIACPKIDGNPFIFKTSFPSKAGDMVYVQSLSQQVICVIDAAGKEQSQSLEAGAGYSFYGAPPFKLLTAGLAQTEIYFQGMRVRPSNPAAKTLILEEASF